MEEFIEKPDKNQLQLQEFFKKLVEFLYQEVKKSECYRRMICDGKHFEKDIIHPLTYNFFLKNVSKYCVICEYQCQGDRKDSLDIAILEPPANVKLVMEIKALPFASSDGEGNHFHNFKDNIKNLGKDFKKLDSFEDNVIKHLLILFSSESEELKFAIGKDLKEYLLRSTYLDKTEKEIVNKFDLFTIDGREIDCPSKEKRYLFFNLFVNNPKVNE
jgi:hypothetical protein